MVPCSVALTEICLAQGLAERMVPCSVDLTPMEPPRVNHSGPPMEPPRVNHSGPPMASTRATEICSGQKTWMERPTAPKTEQKTELK